MKNNSKHLIFCFYLNVIKGHLKMCKVDNNFWYFKIPNLKFCLKKIVSSDFKFIIESELEIIVLNKRTQIKIQILEIAYYMRHFFNPFTWIFLLYNVKWLGMDSKTFLLVKFRVFTQNIWFLFLFIFCIFLEYSGRLKN